MESTEDDHLVWSIPSGAVLTCYRDLVMIADGEVAFASGRTYKVESMHPIALPPYVRLKNDQGQLHTLWAQHLRK